MPIPRVCRCRQILPVCDYLNQNEIICDIQAERHNDESIAGEEEGTATPPSHSTVLIAPDARSGNSSIKEFEKFCDSWISVDYTLAVKLKQINIDNHLPCSASR
jgi:hypothetical protein